MSLRHRINMVVATSLISPAIAWAQDPPPAPAETTAPASQPPLDTIAVKAEANPVVPAAAPRTSINRLVEEVIVTAQKREENLQDVPISITALSAQVLDAKGVLNAQDLPLVTPGLTLSTSVNYLTVFIRGIGSDAFLVADPSVANYIDGIYFPFSNGAIQDFGAIERIEVLKGPQGTLFGRNAVGGAINVITKAPSLDHTEVSFQSLFSENSTTANRLYFNLPLINDSLALGTSFIYNHADNYINGTIDQDSVTGLGGQPLPKDEALGVRAKLRWKPADWLDSTVALLRIHQEGIGSDYTPNTQPSPLGAAAGIKPQDPYAGAVNENLFFRTDNTTFYGQANLYTGPVDLKLIGGHQDIKSYSTYDFDGSTAPLVFFQIEPGAAKVKSLELQALSNDDTWGADRFKWIVGAYYFESNTGFPKGFARLATTDLQQGKLFGIQLPDALVSAVDNALDGRAVPDGTVDFVGTLYSESKSLFAQGTFKFNDELSTTFGGRYQQDRRHIIESSAGLRNFDGSSTTYQDYRCSTNSKWCTAKDVFKPKVSLEYRPGSGLLGRDPLFYASWQQAIKAAAFNVVNITDGPEYVKPEELSAYEAGIKTQRFDGLVTFNAAAFYYNLKNPQVQFVSVLEGGVISFENAGRAEVKGFEFDTIAQLFPSLTDGLVATASATFLDPIYTSYKNGTGFNTTTGILSTGLDFSGNQIQRSPKFSGTASLSQTFTTSTGPIEVAADYFYSAKTFFLAQNSDFSKQDAYGVIGARISYLYQPWGARLTVFGKNIANARYANALVLTDFGRNEAAAPLSTYGLRLNVDF